MKWIIRDVVYHIEDTGKGSPVVLLHGFTGSLHAWDFLIPRLSDHFRLIRVDIIGHGTTEAPDQPARYAMDEVSEDLDAIMNHLKISQAVVLGYSMGGRLALSFAARHPERVHALILESASPGLRTEQERVSRRAHDNRLAAALEQQGIRRFVDQWEIIPLFRSQENLPDEVRKKVRRRRLANREKGLANSLRGMGTGQQPSWWDDLPHAEMPVLLITGRLDEKFCRIARKMDQLLPHSEWIPVTGAGHNVHLEKRCAYIDIVRHFLIWTEEGSERQ
ncbi:2-succinyl-6-hydroxy-2,4-cyclohexadiene-1-carboxylate synthase [Sporolactobacillus sp. Y61]|uniref:Putative 2-succinyl-6-hydroxy-2,4-cyclohexadiene-1-carboxylate synthase n=1 Tax=Sporolactobacillus sp. Y61 TaxID=3160863 RepID=A0AAU8ICH9_9BACL